MVWYFMCGLEYMPISNDVGLIIRRSDEHHSLGFRLLRQGPRAFFLNWVIWVPKSPRLYSTVQSMLISMFCFRDAFSSHDPDGPDGLSVNRHNCATNTVPEILSLKMANHFSPRTLYPKWYHSQVPLSSHDEHCNAILSFTIATLFSAWLDKWSDSGRLKRMLISSEEFGYYIFLGWWAMSSGKLPSTGIRTASHGPELILTQPNRTVKRTAFTRWYPRVAGVSSNLPLDGWIGWSVAV